MFLEHVSDHLSVLFNLHDCNFNVPQSKKSCLKQSSGCVLQKKRFEKFDQVKKNWKKVVCRGATLIKIGFSSEFCNC